MKWLQLSDIHFISDFDSGYCRSKLVDFLREEVQQIDFVVITGDITDKNKPYNESLKKFIEEIASASNIEKNRIIIAPGNHDINRNIVNRNTIINGMQVASNKISEIIADKQNIVALHKGYDEFEKFFATTGFCYQSLNNSLIELSNINLIYLSTCVLSCKDKEEGSLGIDLNELHDLLKKLNKDKSTIAFGHHSLDCLFPECKEKITHLFDDYDIRLYMCGHYHKSGQGTIDISDYKIQEIISGTLSTIDKESPSIFIYDINSSSFRGHAQSYKWINSIWAPNAGYNRDTQGKKEINLIGKSKINSIKKSITTAPIREDELQSLHNSLNKNTQLLWIIGNQGCGKTTFSIDFIKKYHRKKRLIKISAAELNEDKFIEELHRKLNQEIFHLYYNEDIEWENLSKKERFNFCLQAFVTSNYILLIDYINDKQKSLLSKILQGISSSDGLKVIINTYEDCSNNFLNTKCLYGTYSLLELSYNDAKKIIQFDKKDCSATECRQVYDKFGKHLLAISTWAKTKDIDYKEMPTKLKDIYVSLWDRSSVKVKDMITFLDKYGNKYKNLFISDYYDNQLIKKCFESGLLSRQACIGDEMQDIYIHDVVRRSLTNKIKFQFSSQGCIKIIQNLYDKKILGDRRGIMEEYFLLKNFDTADLLLKEEGRLWVEVGQTNNAGNVLLNTEYELNTKEIDYLRYLKGIMSLFSGNYDKSTIEFKKIKTNNSFVRMAITAEKMEIYRRNGERNLAINLFNDLYSELQKINKNVVSIQDVYWIGVSYFLIGQFFKEYGEYELACNSYETSKSYYEENKNSVMCRIEIYHCEYAILSCHINSPTKFTNSDFFGSSFLCGLFNLRYSIAQFDNNKEESMTALQTAKKSFKEINSSSYFTKCLAIELIYLVVRKDIDGIKEYLQESFVRQRDNQNSKISLLKQIVEMIINDNFEKSKILQIQQRIEDFAKKHYTKCILSCMGIIKLFGKEQEFSIQTDLQKLSNINGTDFVYENYHIGFNHDKFSSSELINTILLFD